MAVSSTTVAQSRPTSENSLQQLPAELLCVITSYLDHSDVVCLALTDRELHRGLYNRLLEIRRLLHNAETYSDAIRSTHVRYSLVLERYRITQRLDRDHLARLDRRRTSGQLTCSACVALHPTRYFAHDMQGTRTTSRRRCLASEASIRICSHWHENWLSLRELRRQMRCDAYTGLRQKRCTNETHMADLLGFGAPQMVVFGSTFVVSWLLTVLESSDASNFTLDAVTRSLVARPQLRICPHTLLSDVRVSYAFEKLSEISSECFEKEYSDCMPYLPKFGSVECLACTRSWSFSIIDNGCSRARLRYTLRLNADDRLIPVRNPWIATHLDRVENGQYYQKLIGT